MSDEEKPLSEWARKRAAGKARRARRVERREIIFDLLMSGYSAPQIAKATSVSPSAVRRVVNQALAERKLDAPEHFVRLQVARLNKALRCADLSLEKGEMKAIPHFLKVVAELDRYHALARPMREEKPKRRAQTPPLVSLTLALPRAAEATEASGASAIERSAKEVVSA